MYVDLHIHSTFSDSTQTPEEIVHRAKERGVSLLSICDHTTIAAYDRFEVACRAEGIQPVLGIEMGAILNGQDFHVLAYNFDRNNGAMRDLIRREARKGEQECEDIVRGMAKDFPEVSVEEYRAYCPPPGGSGWKYLHYAVAKGVAPTYYEANQWIFGKHFRASLEACTVDLFCSIVRGAGGVPVLAHPGDSYPDRAGFQTFLRDMYGHGISGIECLYPSHSKEITRQCLDFCKRNDLRVTSGSDCHGANDDSRIFTIGCMKATRDMLDLRGIA